MHCNINIKNYVFLVIKFGDGRKFLKKIEGGRIKRWNYIPLAVWSHIEKYLLKKKKI